MTRSWTVSAGLLGASVGVCFWMLGELGLLSSSGGIAADEAATAEAPKAVENTDKENALAAREQALIDKENVLNGQVKRYEKIITELRQKAEDVEKQYKAKLADKEREVKAKNSEIEVLKNAKIDAFKGMYEKMDSKKAAKILDEMDITLAATILGGMNQARAADILSKMSTERARTITEKSVPKRALTAVPAPPKPAED